MSDVRAICFDLDDTLRDPSGAADALHRTCARLGRITEIDPSLILRANADIWPDLWLEVEEAWTLGGWSGRDVTTEAWRRTLDACGHDDAATAGRASEIHLSEISDAQRLFDDVHAFLGAIDPGLPLAVITNGASDTQRGVLAALGIEEQFDR